MSKPIDLYLFVRASNGADEWLKTTGIPFEIPGCPFHFAVTASMVNADHFVVTNVETGRAMSYSHLSVAGAIEDAVRRWREDPQGIAKGVEESAKAPSAGQTAEERKSTMPRVLTWWPPDRAKDIIGPTLVMLRHDWPDGERIYEFGLYDPSRPHPWTNGSGGNLEIPDYFTPADQVVPFLQIPADREFTYKPSPKRDAL